MSKRTTSVLFSLALAVGLAGASAPAAQAGATPDSGGPVFLAADLSGANEVPAGDPDGHAAEVLRIQGNQISYAIQWKGIAAPTAAHIHLGAKGVNGGVEVPFFGAGIPDGVNAVVGKVTVTDTALLTALRTDPGAHYANVHSAEFPMGAVRGQLHKLDKPVDLLRVLHIGSISSQNTADQEVAGGDQDGSASFQLDGHGSTVRYSLTWSGIAQPTKGHIHKGAIGTNGPVVVDLFAAPNGLPASVTGVAGVVQNVQWPNAYRIETSPEDYYTNLHNAEFPDGAVRGQLFDADSADSNLPTS